MYFLWKLDETIICMCGFICLDVDSQMRQGSTDSASGNIPRHMTIEAVGLERPKMPT